MNMFHELVRLHILVCVSYSQLFRTPKATSSACFWNPFSQFCWKFWKHSVVSEHVSNIPNDFLAPFNLKFRQEPKNTLLYTVYIYMYIYIYVCVYIYTYNRYTYTICIYIYIYMCVCVYIVNIQCYVGQKPQIFSITLGYHRARSVDLSSHHRIAFSAGSSVL